MISIDTETLIPLRDAPGRLPKRSNGKTLHLSAIYRWIKRGVGGVKLEVLRLGGTTYTSAEALQRFAAALSGGVSPPDNGVTNRLGKRRAAAAALEVELGLRPNTLSRK